MLSLWDLGLATCDQDIRNQLKSLPDRLDDIYLRCLRRIAETNIEWSREIASRIFKWLASAQSPFTPEQACEAASMTPDNLPLQQSQLLTLPVTGYCANLVVIDDLTGTVKFPHPSVKDFLFDSEKIPPELRYLSLSNAECDDWCGSICLAHAKLHHSRKQLVKFQSHEIQPKITNPILNNILRNALPFKFKPRYIPSQEIPFQMSLTAVSAQQASSVAHLSLHGYMCQQWLAHNTSIHKDLSHNTDFVNLCVAHDLDLQPWSTSPVTNIEHYKRMVMHAVMTNHEPLLQVALDAIAAKRRSCWHGVFREYIPGTESTYLHCAAVLGHLDVLRHLLQVYGRRVADAHGASAALSAMQAQQMGTFQLLVSEEVNGAGAWQLEDLESGRVVMTECLLDHAAASGNVEAAKILLPYSRLNCLGSAFFLACKNGHQDMGRLLVSTGADHRYFARSSDSKLRHVSASTLASCYALVHAIEINDLKLTKTLLVVRQSANITISNDEFSFIVRHFDGKDLNAGRYVRLVLELGGRNAKVDRPGWELLSWLMCLSNARSVSDQALDDLSRLILRTGSPAPSSQSLLQRRNASPGPVGDFPLLKWFKWAPDDVLVHAVKPGWIAHTFLVSGRCLDVAMGRESPRLIDSIIDLLVGCELWHDAVFETYLDKPNLTRLIGNLSTNVAQKRLPHHMFVTTDPQKHISELLAYTCLVPGLAWPTRHMLLSSIPERDRNRIIEAVQSYDEGADRQSHRLWVRCYLKAKGGIAATRRLNDELQLVGGNGVLALNFPMGYDHVYDGNHQGLYYMKPVISRKIWLAVHRWNFRLNRAFGKPYSASDVEYMDQLPHVY